MIAEVMAEVGLLRPLTCERFVAERASGGEDLAGQP